MILFFIEFILGVILGIITMAFVQAAVSRIPNNKDDGSS